MRRLRRLVQKRSLRWSEGVCVVEGPDLVEAALATGHEVEALYVDDAASQDRRIADVLERASAAGVAVYRLAAGVLDRVADTATPQPILAAVRFVAPGLETLGTGGLTLVLHDVRDPGNVGTVIRSADAAGADAVVLTGHSVDPYNPKTLRATAGSIFHLPVAVTGLAELTGHLRSRGVVSWAAVVRGGTPYGTAALGGSVAVVIGNESGGLDDDALRSCDERLSIPMVGRGESLNLGVAASLVAFEALRQRQVAGRESARPSLGGS
ncbi:MAG: TrmH family RNA methyltransferase [Acidimicrobiales bacterium]